MCPKVEPVAAPVVEPVAAPVAAASPKVEPFAAASPKVDILGCFHLLGGTNVSTQNANYILEKICFQWWGGCRGAL